MKNQLPISLCEKSFDYAYDPIGNRTSAAEYDESGAPLFEAYAANALNQYTQRTVPGYAAVRGEADTNAFVTVNERQVARTGAYFHGGDYADNTISNLCHDLEIYAAINPPGTNTPDTVYAVTSTVFVAKTPETFTYDADGNMTGDGRFAYAWNADNRMVMASNDAVVVTYAYDHRGRMVRKDIQRRGAEPQRVEYTWDNWNIIRETTSNLSTFQPFNFSTSSYVWGLDIDGTLQGAGGVGGLLAVIRDDGVYLPCYDANGNITEYVSTNGEVVAHYDYSPFGEQLVSSGPLADTFTHRFSTKPWCVDTRLVEYQMRKYRPDIGKWMSRDMMLDFDYQIDMKLHEYLFCNNSTAFYFDFVGEYAVAIPVIIETSKIIGAALVVIGTYVTIKVIDAIEDWVSEECANKPQHEPERFCLPCDPPVGSIAYRVDRPPSKAHNGIPTPHSHVYQVMQSPVEKGCKCFWSEIAKDPLPGDHTPYIVNPIRGGGIGYR